MKHKATLFVVGVMLLQLFLPFHSTYANDLSYKKIRVNVDVLNVRSGPGLSHKVISQLRKDEQYPLVDEENNWSKIQLSDSKTGWVASWLVSEIKSETSSSGSSISSNVDGLNVRTGPGLTFSILGQIYPSQQFPFIAEKGSWTNINYNGKSAWVASWLISKKESDPQPQSKDTLATIQATILNVRTGPSTSYPKIGILEQGDQIVITDVKDGWYEIDFNNQKAWVAGDYVKKQTEETKENENNPTTIKAKVTATVLNVRESGSLNGKVIDQITQNTSVEIHKEENDWAYISYGSSSNGWVAGWFLKKESSSDSTETNIDQTDAPKVMLMYDATNLRSGPSTSYSILERGNKGDQFPIISTVGDWYKILLPNNTEAYVAGWIVTASNELPPVEQEGVADLLKGKTFVIDPGHGGRDSGAVGCCNRILEKNLTLKTAELLASKLDSAGAKVIMTRRDDRYISLMFRVSVSHYYDADGFISLHYNSSIFPSARGVMSFYYNEAQEKGMATAIQRELIKATKLNDRGVRYGNYQVLRTNRQPSVLLELGFLSNPEENYLVNTDAYQEKIAEAIYLGLGRYFDS